MARRRSPAKSGARAVAAQPLPSELAHDSSRTDRREWLLLGVILLVTSLAFVNSLNGEFVYDDQFQILENPTIKTMANVPKVFVQSVWQFLNVASDQPIGPYYRPLFNVAIIINYQIFGLKVFGWHLVSILLHLTVTLLVYLLARRWGLSLELAGAAALLFGLHPVHSESVAWISALPDPLASVFVLSSLLLYERYYHEPGGRWYLHVLSLGFAMMAMLAKEVAVVFPFFLVLREWFDRTREEPLAGTVFRTLARTSLFVAVAVLYLPLRYHILGFLNKTTPSAMGIPTAHVFLTIPSILLRYARMLFIPFPLAIVYDDRYVSYTTDPRFWGSALVVVAIIAGAVRLVRLSNLGRRGLVWSVLFLLPVLNLKSFSQEGSLVQDRYLYLPSVGFCLLMALVLGWISSRFRAWQRPIFLTATVLIGVVFLGLTVYQNRSWQNPIALWSHATRVASQKSLLYYALGCAYEARGTDLQAEQEYLKALELDPSHIKARINLAVLITKQSRYEEALGHLQIAQRLAPDHPVMLYALGSLYMRTNRDREAIDPFNQLARLEPQHRLVYTNLGLCYEAVGNREQAKANFQKAIEVAPQDQWTNVAREHLAKLHD